jgi:protein-L-isoaspartate(D-aspartate) O-methyltransferase
LGVFAFEFLAVIYLVVLPGAVVLTGGARRPGTWRAMAGSAAFAAVIVIAVPMLSPAIRFWLGHLYLVAGYWIPALAPARSGETPFEQWLEASDAGWRPRLNAAPACLVHAGEAAYLLCYPVVPAAFLVVWIAGNNVDLNRFWLAVLIGGFACYGSLPWLAARPPRLLPGAHPREHPVARVNVGVLSRVSHNFTTFPSGHVAVSIAAALCVTNVSPAAGLTFALVAVAISIGAVTGGYHYVMDVAAGAAVGVLSALVAITAVAEPGPVSAPAAVSSQRADAHEQRRLEMVERQIASRGVTARRVLDAMRTVPRERFVPPELASRAYDDSPLPIGLGQTISQPYIVAYMTELLRTEPDHRVLEIGTGSGYQAAILGSLAREAYTIEIVPALARRAAVVLKELGYGNVHVREGDGYAGWPEEAPFDRILVTAAPETIPQALLDQLAPGGVLVAPVGSTTQWISVVEKTGHGIIERRTIPVRFVPFTRRP